MRFFIFRYPACVCYRSAGFESRFSLVAVGFRCTGAFDIENGEKSS
jgi:hypothetical protein